jgi:hypothetical protein
MPSTRQAVTGGKPIPGLSAQSKIFDNRSIPVYIFVFHIIEQTAAAADQHQQPSPRMMVLLVDLEMLGEIGNAMGQQGGLNFR